MKRVDLQCPRCSAIMEEGFIYNRSNDEYEFNSWVEGSRETSFWKGTSIKGRARFEIQTYRCTTCGYLESYATTEWKE